MRTRATGNRFRFRAVAAATAVLAACAGPAAGPEAEIRVWIEKGEAAAENRDRDDLVDMISPAYTDARGNSRDDLGNMLRFYFMRQGSVALITRIDRLKIIDDTAAELALQVGMAGTDGSPFSFDADAWTFEMELVREDGDWLLIAARWGGLGEEVL